MTPHHDRKLELTIRRSALRHQRSDVPFVPTPLRPLPYHPGQPDRLRDHHPAAAVLRDDVRRVAVDGRAAVRVVLGQPADCGAAARRVVGPVGPAAGADPEPGRDGGELRDAGDGASLAMLFAARIVDGLSGGNITTARAYIADVTTAENRAKAYGFLGAAFGLGFIIGPALGGVVLAHQLHRADLGGGRRDASWPRRWRGSGCPRHCTAWTRSAVSPWTAHQERRRPLTSARPARRGLHLLDVVRRLPDDLRAVRREPLRLRRRADRLLSQRLRRCSA